MRLSKASFWILVILSAGCGQHSTRTEGVWSQPRESARSSDSLATTFLIHKWNRSLVTLGGDAGTYSVRFLADDGVTWNVFPTTDPSWTQIDVDPNANKLVICRAALTDIKMDVDFSVGSLSANGSFVVQSHATLSLGKAQLFPNAKSNLEMNEIGRISHFGFAGGTVIVNEAYLPYCITATPIEDGVLMAGKSVSANGVFASSDGGRTWHAEPIAILYSESPVVCRTKAFYYYFAKAVIGGDGTYGLWTSRCPVGTASWGHPETLNKSVARQPVEKLHAIGEDETVHLCWLDARNEKTRFSLSRPQAENYEVVYCNRKDSDTKWNKDIILSKGLRWSYAPSMSVEGTNLVVAWAGANGTADRNEYGPSDIYYVTSKDGGKTWNKPIKITDGFKSGITSGRPQVALHKGVIHLFYIQGTLNYQKVSTGMVKLNQPPWPILYQQRPFPK